MARPNKQQMARNETETALFKALENKGLTQKYYKDQVSEYMKFYDNLTKLNEDLEKDLDIEVLKEKRQVTKEMRGLLMFLELAPVKNGGDGDVEL